MLLKNTFAFLYFPSPNQITSYKTAIDFGMESHLVNKLLHHAIYWHQIDLIMTMTMIDQSNINPMKAYIYPYIYVPKNDMRKKKQRKHNSGFTFRIKYKVKEINGKHNRKQIVQILNQKLIKTH